MIDDSYGHGLKFKVSAVSQLTPDSCDTLHNSYYGIWKAFGTRPRFIGKASAVSVSARERIDKLPDYNPLNLPSDPNYEI